MTQTIFVDKDTLDKLDALAAMRSAKREDILKEAVAAYISYQQWFTAKVEAGESDYRAGRYVSQEEAKALAEQRKLKILRMADSK